MFPVLLESISPLLSSATALVKLSSKIDTIFGSSPTASLVAHLQVMPCLRWLALCLPPLISHPHIPNSLENGGKIVPLSEFTFFHFYGHRVSLDSLVSGLAAPSLRTLDMELTDNFTSPIRHISRFMADINFEPESFKFRVISTDRGYFSLSLLTHSESIYDPDPHFNFYSRDVMRIGDALSPRLAIVEELYLVSFSNFSPSTRPWGRFLELFHNVKVLRLQENINVMFDVARSLQQQDQGESASVLPSLEEIELCTWSWSFRLRRDKRRSVMEAFEPFVAARQEAGRPVKIFWGEVHEVMWKFPTDFSALP